MKQYLIKNSDIMLNGKLFPEGSSINLEVKDFEGLKDYLEEIKISSPVTDNSLPKESKNKKRSK